MARPAPVLRPFIARYVGYRVCGSGPGLHRGLPSQHLTFIVSIGPTIDVVRHPGGPVPPSRHRAVLGGLQDGPALIAHGPHQEGVAVELTPMGARGLFRVPAGAMWNASHELADVAGRDGDELWSRLQETLTWPDRFAWCDQILSRWAGDQQVAPELRAAWAAVVRSGGTVTVAEVAAQVGWSRQHLTRRFRHEFGLGPKLAGRVIRFERARTMLASLPPSVTGAQVAAHCGYFDQAHLNRDFAELAGCSPREWRRDEVVPSVQDDGVLDPSRWGS